MYVKFQYLIGKYQIQITDLIYFLQEMYVKFINSE
jgi:hypothetical protein